MTFFPMKNTFHRFLLLCGLALLGGALVSATPNFSTVSPMKQSPLQRSLAFGDALSRALPIAFTYDGKPVQGLPADWKPVARRETADASAYVTTVTGRSPDGLLTLTCEITTYRDAPVVEWLAFVENVGDRNSAVVTDLLAAQMVLPGLREGTPLLWHCLGDATKDPEKDNFRGVRDTFGPGSVFSAAPVGGRPCDNAFPYFRMVDGQGGLFLAIGWPGQWAASFENREGAVHFRAGQQTTDFYLKSGERIRLPRITMLFFDGAEADGVNAWRDFWRAHILPRDRRGQPLGPRWCGYARRHEDIEHCSETTQSQVAYIQKARALGFPLDAWWIDAGWYPCVEKSRPDKRNNWVFVGMWKADPARFPEGLKPLADELAKDDAEFLLWFEPERILGDETIFDAHPEWMQSQPDARERMLDLSNPACVRFLSEYISNFIKKNGIAIYRQDFNFPPLRHWEYMDAQQGEHRRGITENLYLQGYLAYWDYLLATNPGLWIDSCASGGRRNDMETLRRAVPLHYSDFGYNSYVAKQRYHNLHYEWFMYFKDAARFTHPVGDKSIDLYEALCSLSPFSNQCVHFPEGYDFANDWALLKVWRAAKPYLVDGDYWLLSGEEFTDDGWDVFQFAAKDGSSGCIHLIRQPNCVQESWTVVPKGIDTAATYVVSDVLGDTETELTGAELASAGYVCRLPARSGTILTYTKK